MITIFSHHPVCALLIALVLSCLLSSLRRSLASSVSRQLHSDEFRSYDYFMFVRRWPGGVCATQECQVLPNLGFHFTIHGLWPNFNNGTWPQFCAPDLDFDASEVSDLLAAMKTEWPSTFAEWSDEDLWRHEWSKHGTCALDVFPTEHSYFKHILNLHRRYDLAAALSKAGIVPSKNVSYRTTDFVDAINAFYGVRPLVHCDDAHRLTEIWMCLDKDLSPFNCDLSHDSGSCEEVIVPPSKGGPELLQPTAAVQVAEEQQQQQVAASVGLELHGTEKGGVGSDIALSAAGGELHLDGVDAAKQQTVADGTGGLRGDLGAYDSLPPEDFIYWLLDPAAAERATAAVVSVDAGEAPAAAEATAAVGSADTAVGSNSNDLKDAVAEADLADFAGCSRSDATFSYLYYDVLPDVRPSNVRHTSKEQLDFLEIEQRLLDNGDQEVASGVSAVVTLEGGGRGGSGAGGAVSELMELAQRLILRLKQQLRTAVGGGELVNDDHDDGVLAQPNGGALATAVGGAEDFIWTSKLRRSADEIVTFPYSGDKEAIEKGALVEGAASQGAATLAVVTDDAGLGPVRTWTVKRMWVSSVATDGDGSGGGSTITATGPPMWVVLLLVVQLACVVVVVLSLAMLAFLALVGGNGSLRNRGSAEAEEIDSNCSGDDAAAVAAEGCWRQQEQQQQQWRAAVVGSQVCGPRKMSHGEDNLSEPLLLYDMDSDDDDAAAAPPKIHHVNPDMSAADEAEEELQRWQQQQRYATPLWSGYGTGAVLVLPVAAQRHWAREPQPPFAPTS